MASSSTSTTLTALVTRSTSHSSVVFSRGAIDTSPGPAGTSDTISLDGR